MNYKKILNYVGLFVLANSFLITLFPAVASAAPSSGTWIDQTHISYNGQTFTDTQLDDTWDFYANGVSSSSACNDHIDKFSGGEDRSSGGTVLKNPTSALYVHRHKDTVNTSNCVSDPGVTISLTDVGAAHADFTWQDAATIKAVTGQTYTKNSSDGLFYEQGGDSCKDTLQIVSTGSATSPGSANLIVRTTSSDARQAYGDHNLAIYNAVQNANVSSANGCASVTSPITVAISDFNNAAANQGSSSSGSGNTSSSSDSSTATCETSGFSLAWIMCSVINGLSNAVDGTYTDIIQPLLETKPLNDASGTNNSPTFKAWSTFRVIGDIFLVIALLVIVFGQSIGGGLIDAYTAKKVLPRVLAAAILINLSYYIAGILVDITNVLGVGLMDLLVKPFTDGGFAIHLKDNVSGNVGSGLGITALVAAGWGVVAGGGALLSFLWAFVLLPALLIFIAIMVTIFLRRALIIILVIVSPVAFALYCLPNTEKYFRKWWETFLETLMVFPIITALFAAGKIGAVVLAGTSNGAIGGAFANILAVVALIIPLALIPFAFRLAGGVIGRGHELLGGFSKRGHQAMLGNPNNLNSWRNRKRENLNAQYTRKQIGVIDSGNQLGASRRKRFAGALAKRAWGGADERMSGLMAKAKEREDAMSNTGRDALRYAGAGWLLKAGEQAPGFLKATNDLGEGLAGTTADHDRYINSKGAEISRSLFAEGKQRHGRNLTDQAQGFEYTPRKIQTDQDIANMRESFRRNAIAGNWNNNEVMDQWAAATFPHKQAMGTEWYSTPKAVTTGGRDAQNNPLPGRTTDIEFQDVSTNAKQYASYIGEKHKKLQSYQLGSLSDADARASAHHVELVENQIESGGPVSEQDLINLAQTHETFDGMRQRGVITQNADGEVSVSGASAATSGVVGAMLNNRRYDVAPAKDAATGRDSVNERVLYKKAQVEAEEAAAYAAHTATGGTRATFTFDRNAAIQRAKVGQVKVTGDIDRPDVTGVGA